MADSVVENCPRTFQDWSSRASSVCSRDTYHCVEDDYSRIVEVCAVPQWIKAGHCPVYNTMGKNMLSRVCSGNFCPKEVYRSDAVYKYNGCQQFSLSTSMTTSTSPLANTPMSDTSETSTIAVAVSSVLIVILLVVLGIIFVWRKKRHEMAHRTKDTCKQNIGDEKEQLIQGEIDYAALEKTTPKELNADNNLISRCQDYLETRGNTLALIGKLGSGKRTIASQIAIRLAKKDRKLKINIVRDRDVLSEDLKTRHSTVMIINNPFKTWFTSKHVDEIIGCLLEIYANAKTNNLYIIAIFHYNDWNSFKLQIADKNTTMEYIFPHRERICNKLQKLTEMAKSKDIDISRLKIQSDEINIGGPLMMTLFLKNSEFQNYKYLSNPTKFIFDKLKLLEKSSELAFKILVFFVFHDEEIAKADLDDISQHTLFADVKKMSEEASIDGCIKHLLGLFIEETADGRSYRILHDVITRCTFLAALENNMTLLLSECNPILILDCIRIQSTFEKYTWGQLLNDFSSISVGISSKKYPEVARLIYQRTGMRGVLQNSRFYEDKTFQKQWNQAELYFTNEIHEQNETVN